MLKNYLKIAWRNLKKNIIDSFISIGGLAVGIACCLLLVAFVQFEWSFDDFHEKSDQIYLVYRTSLNTNDGSKSNRPITPYPLASLLDSSIPEIEEVFRWRPSPADVKIDDKFVTEQKIILAEPAFLTMFSFPLIAGNSERVLDDPNSVVLTRNKAEQVFGTAQVVGKTLLIRSGAKEQLFNITGVLMDIPKNSSFDFDYLLPFENSLMSYEKSMRDNWFVAGLETFVMLKKGVNPGQVEKKINQYLGGTVPDAYSKRNSLHLLSIQDMYLSPELNRFYKRSSNSLFSWILACIAVVVLAIASINFMSLTLSRVARRGNEISIRKVVGARRGELTQQFMGEALLTCSLAFIAGGVLAELAMPWFSELIDKPVSLGLLNNGIVWIVMAGLLLVATLITGGYPAWVLARQKISTQFTSRTTSGRIPGVVKGLIVMQFALAIALLTSALIMVNQMQFISSKDLGFEPEHLVDIEMSLTNPKRGGKIYDLYSQKVMQLPQVHSVTPIYGQYGSSSMGMSLVMDSVQADIKLEIIDEYFTETMQVNILAGRGFTAARSSDYQTGVLINQEAAKLFGWENPVGKIINQTKYKSSLNGKEIIGVVENYYFRPLYYQIEPLAFVHRAVEQSGVMQMRARIAQGKMAQTLDQLERIWNEINPHETFNYAYVSDLVAQQYEDQQRWESIIQWASGLAILLACFGLFGLAALAAQRRTKEIGIRKVLGATVANIIGLLSKDFLKLVAIGFIIAVPISWYTMNEWLANFAYKIEIGPGIFLGAGGLALLIALVTVSWQSIRAALANPVESLRSE